MSRKVSLKDIAEKVGVSTALVSYVLNNKHEKRINKDVAQKIRETAQAFNYSVNQIAKSLKTKKTFTIGLIVADISNPFFAALARTLEDEAEQQGYMVIYGSSYERKEKSQKLINIFLNRQVDGLIIAATEHSEDQIQRLIDFNVPFVLIDRYFPDLYTNWVSIDNFKAAYTATQHFIKNGYQRIGMISYETSLFNLQERERGFIAAIQGSGIENCKQYIKKISLESETEDIGNAIDALLALPQPVEALLFASNLLSTCGLKHLNTLDIEVPDDLAIISFDESDAAGLFYAPLTFIKQPIQLIGKKAVELLLQSINDPGQVSQLLEEASLVIGKSSSGMKD